MRRRDAETQRTLGCAELVWWLVWWFWEIRQRLLLAVVALVGAAPTANRWCVRPTRSLSMGAYVSVMPKRLTSLVIRVSSLVSCPRARVNAWREFNVYLSNRLAVIV
mgnify:CR=1 FL=1